MSHDITGKSCSVHVVAYLLVLVGALNWGLVGLGGYLKMNLNLVNLLLGTWPVVENTVYILVGLSALAMLMRGHCKECKNK